MKEEIQPDGIIITISNAMIKQRGYKNWLRNFLTAMSSEDITYWMKQGAKPKRDFLYVYLCIGNKVRFRANYVMSEGAGYKSFSDGELMYSRAWIVLSGPLVRPNRNITIPMKGFRGFRYTQFLF